MSFKLFCDRCEVEIPDAQAEGARECALNEIDERGAITGGQETLGILCRACVALVRMCVTGERS